jgi:hypothetical protein
VSSKGALLVFPSVEWFEELRYEVNEHSVLREFGPFDLTLGIRVDDRSFVIRFADERCAAVEEISHDRLAETDFWIDQSSQEWRAMLEAIARHGKAEGEFTLSSLDLKRHDGMVHSSDIFKRDLFYRFNQSLQDFFDASHALKTAFRADGGLDAAV